MATASRKTTARAKAPAAKRTASLSVMLVDDHPLWRETLRKVLERNGLAKVVAEAGDGNQAVACGDLHHVDVVIMDIQLPDKSGIEATRDLVAKRPTVRVLVLASSDNRKQVLDAVAAGASGYLLKTAGSDEVRDAVRRVHEGEPVFPPQVAEVVLGALRGSDGESISAPDQLRNAFRKEGDYWTVSFAGSVFRIRDTRGVRYLGELLHNPGQEMHSLALVGGDAARRDLRGDAGPLLDAPAKAAYRQRMRDLEEDLQEAESFEDIARASKIREEIEALRDQLGAAVGLGGRDRKAASAAERARVNVTLAIKSTLSKIADYAPALSEHLASTIKTGMYCSYTPDPRAPITWD